MYIQLFIISVERRFDIWLLAKHFLILPNLKLCSAIHCHPTLAHPLCGCHGNLAESQNKHLLLATIGHKYTQAIHQPILAVIFGWTLSVTAKVSMQTQTRAFCKLRDERRFQTQDLLQWVLTSVRACSSLKNLALKMSLLFSKETARWTGKIRRSSLLSCSHDKLISSSVQNVLSCLR